MLSKNLIKLFMLPFIATTLQAKLPPFLEKPSKWAEEIFSSMTLEEKIGQFFVVAVPISSSEEELQIFENLVRTLAVGGIFLAGKGSIEQQKNVVTRLQLAAGKIPLLVCEDLEWGPDMRLSDGMAWPKALTLGAIDNDELVYQAARAIAQQAHAMDVHITASPVADVNTNPLNPIINTRSFGDNPLRVAAKAVIFMKGLQENGILACGKHFPGHGDTEKDSHNELPKILHTKEYLFENHIAPFVSLIEQGASIIMVGHLSVPILDPSGIPASLSNIITTKLLKEELGFKGLIMSDALNMKALPQTNPVELNFEAYKAGIDLITFPEKVSESIKYIKNAVQKGCINRSELEMRSLNILKAKEWLNLHNQRFAKKNLIDNSEYLELKQSLYVSALTRLHDEHKSIPLSPNQKIAVICLDQLESFAKAVKNYGNCDILELTEFEKIPLYDSLVLAIKITPKTSTIKLKALEKLSKMYPKSVIVLFSSPYTIHKLPPHAPKLIAYEDSDDAQEAAAKGLLGMVALKGKLPVEVTIN